MTVYTLISSGIGARTNISRGLIWRLTNLHSFINDIHDILKFHIRSKLLNSLPPSLLPTRHKHRQIQLNVAIIAHTFSTVPKKKKNTEYNHAKLFALDVNKLKQRPVKYIHLLTPLFVPYCGVSVP